MVRSPLSWLEAKYGDGGNRTAVRLAEWYLPRNSHGQVVLNATDTLLGWKIIACPEEIARGKLYEQGRAGPIIKLAKRNRLSDGGPGFGRGPANIS